MMNRRVKRIIIYVVLVLIIFLPGTIKYYRLCRQKELNQARLRALMQENRRLMEENKKLREDPVYIEQMARENLGLAKPGEFVVKFKNQD